MNFFKDDFPFDPVRRFSNYQFVIAFLVGILFASTLPAQASTLMIFIPGFKQASGFNDIVIGTIFFTSSVLSAYPQKYLGRKLDEMGERKFVTYISIAMTILLLGIAFSRQVMLEGNYIINFLLIVFIFCSLRTLAIGCLNSVGNKLLALWFDKISLASIPVCIISSIVRSYLVPLLSKIKQEYSWETAILSIAASFLLLSIVFWLLFRGNKKTQKKKFAHNSKVVTLEEAKKTKLFWIMTLVFASCAVTSAGACIHLENILLGEEKAIYVIKMTWTSTTFFLILIGIIGDKLKTKTLLLCVYMTLCCTLIGIITSNTLLLIIGFGGTVATYRNAFIVTWPRVFGTKHQGEITGYARRIVFYSSAISPLCFASVKAITGSYELMGYAVLALVFAISSFIILDKTQ